jgi:hypothetical protein
MIRFSFSLLDINFLNRHVEFTGAIIDMFSDITVDKGFCHEL